MKVITGAALFLVGMSAWAVAQDGMIDDLWVPSSFSRIQPSLALDSEGTELPGSSSAEPLMEELPASFSFGPAGGYISARGADRGTWFGGVQARLHFLEFLAAEASITFHQNRYDDGDVIVTQFPVQLTAMFYIIPAGPIRPYILGGVGWYYTKNDYRGAFSSINDRTQNIFGEHLGAGGEFMLGPRTSVDLDVRYIFMNPSNDQVIHRDYDYWQITFGVNFFF